MSARAAWPVAAIAVLGLLAGCGEAARGAVSGSAFPPPPTTAGPAGSPTATPDAVPAASAPAPFTCAATVRQTLDGVTRRVLLQTTKGRDVADAVQRLSRPGALGDAVERGDTAAATVALRPLLKHQIVRLRLLDPSGKVVLDHGTVPAMGGAVGTLTDRAGHPAGTFTVATAAAQAIDGLVGALTGDEVAVQQGSQVLASTLPAPPADPAGLRSWTDPDGTRYRVRTLPAIAFGSLPARLVLLRPAGLTPRCGPTRARTVADTDLGVAKELFASESAGRHAHRVLAHVAHDPRFAAAVQHDDPTALRAAIVRFFRDSRLHVVRIRATDRAGRLVNDVGGPDVLAPISGPVIGTDGRPVGRVTLSVQDDTGYVKLLERFTGAAVQLATPAGAVPGGTLPRVPADLPDHGSVQVAGRRYVATGMTATAYPAGPLEVRLLLPETPALTGR